MKREKINKSLKKNESTIKCHKSLQALANSNNKIALSWIPGHRGHDGNELADTLAKIGTTSKNKITHLKTPLQTMKHKIKEFYITDTIFKFLVKPFSDECHNPIKALLQKNRNFGNTIHKMDKEDSSIITKVLTGHNNLKKNTFTG